MKNFLLFFLLVFVSIEKTSACETKSYDDFYLTIGIIDPIPQGGPHRTPPSVVVDLEGHTLIFDEEFAGCTINLMDSANNIVFTDTIDSDGIVELPNNISGTYVLKLIVEDVFFQGEIQIE